MPSRPIHIVLTLLMLSVAGVGAGWLIGRARSVASRPAGVATTAAVAASKPAPAAVHIPETEVRTPTADRAGARPSFQNVSARRKTEFNYMRGETGEFWLPETMGGGVAWLDFDGDGLQDLYCVQGCQLPDDPSARFAAVLYRNTGDSHWEEIPRAGAPSNTGYGIGVTVGDMNHDGFDDIYVTNFGTHTYWENRGDGTFDERGVHCGLKCSRWGTSAAFGDLDRDGNLDLFVANYVQHDPAIRCTDPTTGKRKYCGPDYYDGESCVLYANSGDGRFADISDSAGIARQDGKPLGVVIADLLADDGVSEIFVANDLKPNFLFRQTGEPFRFEEAGFVLGAAVNSEGVREANMGVACADYDADADLDLYVTHYYMEHDTLWENQGPGGFADVTKRVGVSLTTLRQLSWGTNFIDYDNDGWLDLFITSGHINDSEVDTIPYAMSPQLFRNLGSQGPPTRFADVSARAGNYFLDRHVGRSSASADFDRDGRIDLAVGHHHRPLALLRNETDAANAIGFLLVGRRSNRSAIGARVTVIVDDPVVGERRLMREIIGGGSYISADSRVLLVGIGAATSVKAVEIRWPSGARDHFENLGAGGYWTVQEGHTEARFVPFTGGSP